MMSGCWLRLQADMLSLRRTTFFWLHLLLPIVTSILFLVYFSFTTYDEMTKLLAYKQVLAVLLPLIISLVCSIVVEVEWTAGRYYHLLSVAGARANVLASKLILLLVSGFIAIQAAVWLFDIGYGYMLNESKEWSIRDGLITAVVLFGSSVVFYMFHLWLNMRFGKEVSLGIGILGVLIAALMQTGLGDGRLWTFVPYSWSGRFVASWMITEQGEAYDSLILGIQQGVVIAAGVSIASIVILFFWFKRWEGLGGEA